jgi:hypothetical protein
MGHLSLAKERPFIASTAVPTLPSLFTLVICVRQLLDRFLPSYTRLVVTLSFRRIIWGIGANSSENFGFSFWYFLKTIFKRYGLLAVGFAKFGDEHLLKTEPIKHLFEIYVKINKAAEEDPTIHDEARAYFSRMEKGDADALKVCFVVFLQNC